MRAWLVVLASILTFSSAAWANTAGEVRKEMEAANVKIADFSVDEYADEAAQELAAARLEIGDVQTLLGKEDVAKAQVVMTRLNARIRLIESILARARIQAEADTREGEAIRMLGEADSAQLELESLQRRRGQLQVELQNVIDRSNSNNQN